MSQTLTLRIESLAHGGAAVAHADDGRAVFVTGGCPGDTLLAEVTADHGRYLEARTVEVLEPSEDRRTPPCPYFGECGGCQWQHVSHQAQIAAKRATLSETLRRIGGFADIAVPETVTAGSAYGYRNRIELRAELDDAGRLLLGFSARHDDRLVPVDACLLLPERARKAPKGLSGALRYLSRGGPLGLHRVAVDAPAHSSDLQVDLWAAPGPFPRGAVGKTLADAVRATSVTRVLYAPEQASRKVRGVEVLSGAGAWRETLGEYRYRVTPPSFFQVNTAVAERLVGLVLDAAAPDGTDRVLDLYSGVGTFTLPLAEAAGEVVAIEAEGSAVRDLRHNLEENGLDADVMPGDAARALADAGSFDIAVVDPPRAGLGREARDALLATGARRVVYVSCDPATLARDARALADSGLALIAATPVDMFPQTYHVETVAVFERPGA